MTEDREYRNCRKEETGWASLSEALGIQDPEAETQLKQIENRATLEKLLPNLRERWRAVLKYRFFDGLTQKETGQILGINNARVSSIEQSALRRLKRQIIQSEKAGKSAW